MEYSRSLKCSKKDTGRLVYIELLFQGYPASSWVQHKNPRTWLVFPLALHYVD